MLLKIINFEVESLSRSLQLAALYRPSAVRFTDSTFLRLFSQQ